MLEAVVGEPDGRSRPFLRRAATLLRFTAAATLATGCGKLVDENAYRLQPVDDGGGSDDGFRSRYAVGSIYVPECMDCLSVGCRSQLDECDANSECATLLDCIADCSDPGCITRCSAPNYGPQHDWPIEDVEECLKASCLDVCPIGTTYDCNEYAWATVYDPDETVALRVKVLELTVGLAAGVPDVEVTPCLRSEFATDPCPGGLASAVTDADGWAEFEIQLSGAGLDGFLEAHDPTAPELTYRQFRDLPAKDYWDFNQMLVDRSGAGRQLYTLQTMKEFGPGVGAIFFDLYDCNTWPADDLTLTVEPSGDAWIFYTSLMGRTVGEGRKDDQGDVIPNAPFIAVVAPPGDYDFVFTEESTGKVVRRATFPILDSHFDSRLVYPRAEQGQ